VVRTLVYSKIPNTVCDWVDAMARDWRFERIIPAHFSAPIRAGGFEAVWEFEFGFGVFWVVWRGGEGGR